MRLPEPYTFFVDRSLGSIVVAEGLRAIGEIAIAHDEKFDINAPDEAWLAVAGESQWVVLTKDVRIRRNSLSRSALLAAGVAAFVLARGDVSGPVMVQAFAAAIKRIRTTLRRFDAPLIGSVSLDGSVTIMHDGHSQLLPPHRIK